MKLKRVCDGKKGMVGLMVCDKSMNNNGIDDEKLKTIEIIKRNMSLIIVLFRLMIVYV